MDFAETIYKGKSITDLKRIILMLEDECEPLGVFCVCKKKSGKFLYEIMSARQLLKDRNEGLYTVYGVAAGKREAFEVVKAILEDTNEF